MSATKELQTNFIVDITPWRNIIRKNMSLKMFHWEFCEIFWKSFFKKPPQNNCYWCRENFIFCAVDQDVSYCWQVFDRILVLLGVVLEDFQESTYRGISFQYSCSFTKIKSIEGTYHRLFLKFPYSFFQLSFHNNYSPWKDVKDLLKGSPSFYRCHFQKKQIYTSWIRNLHANINDTNAEFSLKFE